MATIQPVEPIEGRLALDMVRVTEAASIAASRCAGMGDKNLVDQSAVDAMRSTLRTVLVNGIVVIGEGEKDEAPMLHNGEQIGAASHPKVDIAVDPIDGTTLLSKGLPGAISALAISSRGSMTVPKEVAYTNKIAVGPVAAKVVDINASVEENLRNIAEITGRAVGDLSVVVLDRPRHDELLKEIRSAGARVKLISDGDVVAGIQTALPGSGVDVLMGIGGTPEAVLTAAALRCVGGAIQAKPWVRNDLEKDAAKLASLDLERVFTTEDLVSGSDVFFAATGATTGELLRGVRFYQGGAYTQSLVMHSRSGTVRWVDTMHDFTLSSQDD